MENNNVVLDVALVNISPMTAAHILAEVREIMDRYEVNELDYEIFEMADYRKAGELDCVILEDLIEGEDIMVKLLRTS